MNFLNINLDDLIINDPIFNNKNESFYSEIFLSSKSQNSVVNFISQAMKITKIEIINGQKFITLEFLNNHPQFYEFVHKLEDKAFDIIFQNGENWFGNKPKYETLNQLFDRKIVVQQDLRSNPTMIFEITDDTMLYDQDHDEIDFNQLELNNEIICQILIKGVFFLNNKFYLDYSIQELKIKNTLSQLTEYLFSNSENE